MHLASMVGEHVPCIIYAGITGSALITDRATDTDIVASVSNELEPALFYLDEGISILAFDASWLDYKKHEKEPKCLVPSILFKSIALSRALLGEKDSICLPKIRVCMADWINVEIKKARFVDVDRKNYLVALIFEKLLKESPQLNKFSFDNIAMARSLGLGWIAEELEGIYSLRKDF